MAQQWEYKSIIWPHEKNGEANDMGAQGWELVSVVNDTSVDFESGIHHGCSIGYFKRRIAGGEA